MVNTFLVYTIAIAFTIVFAYSFAKHNGERVAKIVVGGSKYSNYNERTNYSVTRMLLIAFPLSLLLATRYNTGSDYLNYQRIYNNYIATGRTSTELGFKLIMKLSDAIFHDYKGFVALTSVLTILLFVNWLIKETDDYSDLTFAMLIMISSYFQFWFVTVRQVIAAGFAIYAFRYIHQRRFVLFCIFSALAILFHGSAVIIVPLYFLYSKTKITTTKQIVRMIFVVISVTAFAYIYIRYAQVYRWSYAGYITSNEGGSSRYFLMYSLMLYIPELLCMNKVIRGNKKYAFYYILLLLEVLFLLAGNSIAFGFRLSLYFSAAHAIIIPKVINTQENRFHATLLRVYYPVITITWFIISIFVFEYGGLIPYTSIF